jgi:hypothetical protein
MNEASEKGGQLQVGGILARPPSIKPMDKKNTAEFKQSFPPK